MQTDLRRRKISTSVKSVFFRAYYIFYLNSLIIVDKKTVKLYNNVKNRVKYLFLSVS